MLSASPVRRRSVGDGDADAVESLGPPKPAGLLDLVRDRLRRGRARAVTNVGVVAVALVVDAPTLGKHLQSGVAEAATPRARSVRGREEVRRTAAGCGVTLRLLRQGGDHLALAVRVGLRPAELALAELVQVFLTRLGVVGIVHPHVAARLAAVARVQKVLVVPALEDVDLGVVDLGVDMVVQRAVLGTKMLSTAERAVSGHVIDWKRKASHSQGRRSLNAELTVENKDRLLARVAASGRARLGRPEAEKEVLDARGGVDVDSSGDVPAVVLVVEAAVDYVVSGQSGVVFTVKKIVQLRRGNEGPINDLEQC